MRETIDDKILEKVVGGQLDGARKPLSEDIPETVEKIDKKIMSRFKKDPPEVIVIPTPGPVPTIENGK